MTTQSQIKSFGESSSKKICVTLNDLPADVAYMKEGLDSGVKTLNFFVESFTKEKQKHQAEMAAANAKIDALQSDVGKLDGLVKSRDEEISSLKEVKDKLLESNKKLGETSRTLEEKLLAAQALAKDNETLLLESLEREKALQARFDSTMKEFEEEVNKTYVETYSGVAQYFRVPKTHRVWKTDRFKSGIIFTDAPCPPLVSLSPLRDPPSEDDEAPPS